MKMNWNFKLNSVIRGRSLCSADVCLNAFREIFEALTKYGDYSLTFIILI